MIKIPGFRSGKPWKKVVASIGYLFIILIIYGIAKGGGSSTPTSSSATPTSQASSGPTAASTPSASASKPTSPPKVLTIQDIASKNNISIGSLNKGYRLDTKYKYNDGVYMFINFQHVKAVKELIIGQKKFNNVIEIGNVPTLAQTSQIFEKAGYFTLYDEYGKETSDFNTYIDNESDGLTAIVLNSNKNDLTKYKYLAFGPIDINYANGMQLLFAIQ